MPTLLIDQAHKNFFKMTPGAPRSLNGLRELAQHLGYGVQLLEADGEEVRLETTLLDGLSLVVLPVPTEPYSPSTLAAFTTYCKSGGNLLLLQEEGSDRNWGNNLSDLAQQAGLRFGNYFWSGRNEIQVIEKLFLGIIPGINDGVITISLRGTCDVELLSMAGEPDILARLLDREGQPRPIAVRARLGQGHLYAFGDCSLFSEGALNEAHNPLHARGNRRLLENILRQCAEAQPEIVPTPELQLARNLEAEAEQANDLRLRADLYEQAAIAYGVAGSLASQERYTLFARVLRHPRLGRLLEAWYPYVGQEEILFEQPASRETIKELVGRVNFRSLNLGRLNRSGLLPYLGLGLLVTIFFYFLIPLNLAASSQVLSSLLQGLLGVLAIGFVGLQLRDQLRQEAGASRFLAGDSALLEEAQRLYQEPKTLLCLLYIKYLEQLSRPAKSRSNYPKLDSLLQSLWQGQNGARPRLLGLARTLTGAWEVFGMVELDTSKGNQLAVAETTEAAPLLPGFFMPFAQIGGRLKFIAEDIAKGISRRELENRISGQLIFMMGVLAATILLIMVIMPLQTEANVNEPLPHLFYSLTMGLVTAIILWLFLYIRVLVRRE